MVDVLKEEGVVDPGRLQSPSSILTYKQCPRKYFYRYIAKLPVSKSIHLIRGSVAHKVLEDVYDIDISNISEESFLITMKYILQELFRKEWEKSKEELAELGMDEGQLQTYYDETRVMINNFFHYLVDRMQQLHGVTIKEAFQQVKPMREVELHSKYHHVRGYADAIQREGEKLVIIDYKTSRKMEISEDYRLQLGIYCLIYEEIERAPDEIGIFFLKHGRELRMPVTRDMIDMARHEVQAIHLNTKSKDVRDYPRKISSLCKWSTGQCEFYDTCFSKTLDEYDEAPVQIGKKN
jgi:putative RecB family exonuclease